MIKITWQGEEPNSMWPAAPGDFPELTGEVCDGDISIGGVVVQWFEYEIGEDRLLVTGEINACSVYNVIPLSAFINESVKDVVTRIVVAEANVDAVDLR